jgi:hypothetical protein
MKRKGTGTARGEMLRGVHRGPGDAIDALVAHLTKKLNGRGLRKKLGADLESGRTALDPTEALVRRIKSKGEPQLRRRKTWLVP